MEGRPDGQVSRLSAWLGSVAIRLAQIQVCVIYFYSAIKKLTGPSWWHGDAIWQVLANPLWARFDFSWMAACPTLVMFLTYSTLLWELYFPALIWVRRVRYPVLALGVGLHLGISLTMILPFFGLTMIATYTLFIDEGHIESAEKGLRRGVARIFYRKGNITLKRA
jgi:hypothetical protein